MLVAPPGAGKSTVVPLALLDETWAKGRKILLLEPRRLAARAVATRMAQSLGEQVGATVGYRMRMDTRVGPATRLEVVTEGVLTRMLQNDPALEGVAAVLFDEFHERSLHADLGLALCLQAQETVAPQLRLLVMSATIDAAAVAALLGNAPVIDGRGSHVSGDRPLRGQGPAGAAAEPHAVAARTGTAGQLPCAAHWMKQRAMCWCSCRARRRSIGCAIFLSRQCAVQWTCTCCMETWTLPRNSGCWNRPRPDVAS